MRKPGGCCSGGQEPGGGRRELLCDQAGGRSRSGRGGGKEGGLGAFHQASYGGSLGLPYQRLWMETRGHLADPGGLCTFCRAKGKWVPGSFSGKARLPGAGPGLWPETGKERRLSCKAIVEKGESPSSTLVLSNGNDAYAIERIPFF